MMSCFSNYKLIWVQPDLELNTHGLTPFHSAVRPGLDRYTVDTGGLLFRYSLDNSELVMTTRCFPLKVGFGGWLFFLLLSNTFWLQVFKRVNYLHAAAAAPSLCPVGLLMQTGLLPTCIHFGCAWMSRQNLSLVSVQWRKPLQWNHFNWGRRCTLGAAVLPLNALFRGCYPWMSRMANKWGDWFLGYTLPII